MENNRIFTMKDDFIYQCTYETAWVERGYKERMSEISCIAAETAASYIIYT